ncbi:hypothetical protein CWATWH0402_3675 [Crocosphaera watsonii WH 0402]|uniref:Uncharacterized protein n=1 Tax=Crocosphaera watsonii WH 0402 TaxID=1284629 RepID=T2JSW7_CROWT|nr:hypothetical protein CWATWH0402_3675 [Crocosphaera watsonii WH 0402]
MGLVDLIALSVRGFGLATKVSCSDSAGDDSNFSNFFKMSVAVWGRSPGALAIH